MMFLLVRRTLQSLEQMGKDKRGIDRGKCTECEDCDEFETASQNAILCDYCGHRPVKHIPSNVALNHEPPEKKSKHEQVDVTRDDEMISRDEEAITMPDVIDYEVSTEQ